MVDKGFTIAGELAKVGATLVTPPFLTAKRTQFSKQEVTDTQAIARVRVHVERANTMYIILSYTMGIILS